MKHLDLNEINSLNKRKTPSDNKKLPQPIHSLTHTESPEDLSADKNKKAMNKD